MAGRVLARRSVLGTRSFVTRARRRKAGQAKAAGGPSVSKRNQEIKSPAVESRGIGIKRIAGKKSVSNPMERLQIMSSVLNTHGLSGRRKIQLIERMILIATILPQYTQRGIIREASLRGVIGRKNGELIGIALKNRVQKGKIKRERVGLRRVV